MNGIDIIIKKQPSGSAIGFANSDASGTVRFRIPEAGTYTIEIQNPLGTGSAPEGAKAMSVKIQGQTSKAVKTQGLPSRKLPAADEIPRLATGRMVQDASPTRNRLEHPGIAFDESGRSHIETITVTDATDLMLRLTDDTRSTDDPQIYGLPPYLSFVAIEGGPSPLPHVMESGSLPSDVSLEWTPATATNSLPVVLTDVGIPQIRTQKRTSVAPNTRGLPVGVHGGNIVFRINGVEVEQTVPVYVRILPRDSTLPPVADRKTLYYSSNSTAAFVTVYNPNAAAETYTLRNEAPADNAAVLFSPQEFTLAPGESRRVIVQFLGNPEVEEKQVNIVNRRDESYTLHLLKPRTPCTENKLYPVIGTLGLNASAELGANATIEVYNSCGGQNAGLLVKATDESSGKSVLLKTIGVANYGVALQGGPYKLEVSNLLANGVEASSPSRNTTAIRQLNLPALADDDQPVIIEEVVNATSGEPSALAPGMTALYRGHIPIGCCEISFGDKQATNIQRTDDGLLFDVPVDLDPQGKAPVTVKSLSNIKPQKLGVFITPSSPTLETQADGTVLLLKHADLEDPGDDYTTNGNAPPKAGDLVSVSVTGLGLATLDDIRILVNGAPAQLNALELCYGGVDPPCPLFPNVAANGRKLFFTLPEVPLADDLEEGSAAIQVMALDVTSNIGSTTNIKSPGPGKLNGFLVSTDPPGRTVNINGADFTYNVPGPFDPYQLFGPTTDAKFDVIPEKQPGAHPYIRYDFQSWSFGGPTQQTRTVPSLSHVVAIFTTMVKVTITGGTITPAAADGFYPINSDITISPSCPTGQVFDTVQYTSHSLLDGAAFPAVNIPYLTPTLYFPYDFVVKCKAAAAGTVQVTLNTNLGSYVNQIVPALSPTLSLNQTGPNGSSGAGWPTYSQPVNPGAVLLSVTPTQLLHNSGDLRFDFKIWTGNGVNSPGNQNVNQLVNVPNAATTYTANFDMLNKLTVTVNGTCVVTPASGFYLNASSQTLTVTPAASFQSAVYAPGTGGTNINLTNGQTFQFVGGTLTVNCGTQPPVNACVVVPSGPATWWPLESATLPIPEILPLGLNAVASPVAGSAVPTVIPGKVGNALRFNGVNQFLNVPYNPVFDSLRSEDGFTLDAWVKLDGSKDGGAIFGNHRNTGNNGYYFGATRALGATLYLGAYRNAGGYEAFSANLPIPDDGQWHFVAARMKRIRPSAGADPTRTEVTLWVDGAKTVNNAIQPTWDLSTTIDFSENCVNPSGPNGLCWANPVTFPAKPILLGTRDTAGTVATPQFDGGVDELEFFKRPLTDDEVASIYNAGSFGKCEPTPSTSSVNVTVITNPPNVLAQVGIGSGKSPGIHSASLPGGSAQTVTADDPFLGTDGNYYRFNNWTPAGPGVTLPASGSVTYTANYNLVGGQVDASGCGITVGPTSRQISANPLIFSFGGMLFINATPPTGQTFQNFTVTPLTGGAAITYNTNGINIPFNGPIKIVANCGVAASIPITLVSSPLATGPNLTLAFTGLGTAPITSGPAPGARTVNIPGGTTAGSLTLQAQPQFVGSNTGYTFNNFTPNAPAGNPAIIQPLPATATTYTANYTVACYVLIVTVNPPIGGLGTVSKSPATGVAGFTDCYAPGTTVTLTANPAPGQALSSWTGATPGSGNTATVVMSQPRTVTANFGAPANVTLTVNTSPQGLDARIGAAGAFTAAPLGVSVPANQSQTVSVTDPIVKNGTGYKFSNWTGATPANSATASVAVGSSNATATANFTVACYVVTITTVGTGTITPTTLGGGVVTGFPGGCYSPGSIVRINNTPGANQGLKSIVVTQPSGTQTYTATTNVTIGGPTTIVVTFAPRPNPILSVTQPVLSGGSYTSNISFTNSTASPGTNLRITGLTFTQAGVTLTTALPINYGNLPASGSAGSRAVVYTIPSSVASGTTFVMNLVVEVTNVNGDVFTSTPSFSQTKP